ncbi:unnamed protein product [Calicophoron daubneyi]|uniref:C2H2-type domain-containing protein n=1 Tax=Calicophoron daubneyi TaxID=300641 RepID=A0AAV2TAB3_CALDB
MIRADPEPVRRRKPLLPQKRFSLPHDISDVLEQEESWCCAKLGEPDKNVLKEHTMQANGSCAYPSELTSSGLKCEYPTSDNDATDNSLIHLPCINTSTTTEDASSPPNVHTCNLCGKSFTLRGTLQRHRASVHEGKKPHCCTTCGKRFSESKSLRRHQSAVHYGEKPHSCSICGRNFSESRSLRRHQAAIHYGEKPYSCESCGKMFTELGNLKKHQAAVHEGLKRFSCSVCGRRFTQLVHMRAHRDTVHKIS